MSKGVKYSGGKIQYHLLPVSVIREVIRVLMFGAEKYSEDNWKYVEPWDIEYTNAAKRHIDLWWQGHVNDGDECGNDKKEKI